jgi:hypothetical protein
VSSIYFQVPGCVVASNFKVASSSIVEAIINTHYPNLATVAAAHKRKHSLCPKVSPIEDTTVLLLVRDPIERFKSACAECGVANVPAMLSILELGWPSDVHLLPQARLIRPTTKLYRFPDHLEELAVDAGLNLPLPRIEGSYLNKPFLSDKDIERLKLIYKIDLDLFESIQFPGQPCKVPSVYWGKR